MDVTSFSKPLIDDSFESAQERISFDIPILLIILFVGRGILSYLATVTLHLVAQKIIADSHANVF